MSFPFADRFQKTGCWGILAAGILVRLVLMPLTFHGDILFIHHLPMMMLHEGSFEIYSNWGRYFMERSGSLYYPPFVLYAIALYQYLLSFAAPLFQQILMDYHGVLLSGAESNVADFLSRYSLIQRLMFSFLAKLIYVPFDLLSLLVLRAIFSSDSENKKKVTIVWMLSPVLIFSTAIMGQYRILSFFCALWMLYSFRKGQEFKAFLLLACICLMENYPWLLLPLFLLIYTKFSFKSVLNTLVPCAALLIFVLGGLVLSSGVWVLYSYASPVVLRVATGGVFPSWGPAAALVLKVIFAGGYLSLLLCLWKLRSSVLTSEARWLLTVDVSLALLLLLYATSSTSIHYFMWVLPFWVCRHRIGAPWGAWVPCVMIILLFFFNMDSRALNLGLLIPLNPDYFKSLPSLHEIMSPFMPWGRLVGLARLGFSVMGIALAVKIIKPYFVLAFQPTKAG